MAITPMKVLNEEGLKTLLTAIFKTIDANWIRKTQLPKEVLGQLVQFKFKIKDEDGCLYLTFPEGIDDTLVDQVIESYNSEEAPAE